MTSHSTARTLLPSTQSRDCSNEVSIGSRGIQIRPLDGPEVANRNESAEDYSRIIAVLDENWRVIECPGEGPMDFAVA